jgi:hypothetical protein
MADLTAWTICTTSMLLAVPIDQARGSREMMHTFDSMLDQEQRHFFAGLSTPARIQAFLDQTPYSPEEANRCPLSVLRDGLAHCLDGALFAAAALRRLGYPPLIVDLLPEPGMDDDHVVAIYRRDGHLGALAKSNFVGLRFREPVYRNLRELVLSYFELYFNVNGQKTLRSYTRPLNLASLDKQGWMWSDAGADAVEKRLGQLSRLPLLTEAMIEHLTPVDKLSYRAGMLGVNKAGLYKPTEH